MDINKNQCSVTFDKKEFDDIISKAKNTTESKSILPILSNFLIEIENSHYFVKATDLENYIKIEGKAEQSDVSCVLCINSKKLSDIIKSLSSATFTITLVEDDVSKSRYIQIQSGRSKFKLTLAEASEFPAFPEIEEDMISNTILGSLLLEGLERTDYAVAKEDTANPTLTGVNVIFDNQNGRPLIEFAATDGNRLTVFKKQYPQDETSQELTINNVSFTIPKKTVKILKTIVNKASFVNVYYKPGSSFLIFEDKITGWTLFSRLLEGEFPDYKMYIEHIERPINAKIQRKELRDLIKRLSFSGEGSVIPIKLTFSDNILIGETSDREFTEGRDEIDIDYVGDAFSVDLNARYLKEAVDYAPSDYINVSTDDPMNGILVSCGNLEEEGFYYASLIMPFG